MTNISDNRYFELFENQKVNQFRIANTNYKTRIKKLKALRIALEKTYKQEIRDALYADFKKPKLEVDLTEIYPVIDEINFVTRHLKSW